MAILSSVRNRIGRWLLREHVGTVLDDDEHLFRPLVESPDVDDPLGEVRRERNRRLARVHYHRSAIGGALPDMLVARVIGADLRFEAEDPDVQAVVDRFIVDPDNDLEAFTPRAATELLVFGELFLPVFLTPENADMRLGYLLPDQVERVVWRAGDLKKPLAFVQKRGRVDDVRRLWVIPHPEPGEQAAYPPHPALTPENEPGSVDGETGPVVLPNRGGQVLPEIAELLEQGDVQVAGYAFYHRTGTLVSGRGRSLYERVNDWLKAADDWLFGTLRNAILQGSFVWWVKLVGGQEADVRRRQQELGQRPPRPGSLLVTNDREEWSAIAPALPAAAGIREILTGTLKLIGLAVGLPGHEVGAEDDTNRATASESRSVAINRAKRFQRDLAAVLCTWLRYQVDQKIHRGQLPAGVARTVRCVLPELDVRDEREAAAALQATVAAAVTAVDRELMLVRDARAAVYQALGQEAPTEEAFRQALEMERRERDETFLAGAGDRLAAIVRQLQDGPPGTPPVPPASG